MARYELEIYFLGPERVASGQVHVAMAHGLPAIWLRNSAFVCPVCCETWGRRVFINPPLRGWQIVPRSCQKHGGGYFLSSISAHNDLLSLARVGAQTEFLLRELLLWEVKHDFDYLDRKPAAK